MQHQAITTSAVRATRPLHSSLTLTLEIQEPVILDYLSQFHDPGVQQVKALEALKVGVIAICSATPSLDTQVVQTKFGELEQKLQGQLGEFQREVKDALKNYFCDQNGSVPRRLSEFLGDDGKVTRTLRDFFDPEEGRLARLMQRQIGPDSIFSKSLDPNNKQGILVMIEEKVQQLVETKLDEVVTQFSLDDDGSAMSRLKKLLDEQFVELNKALGVEAGKAAEAERGTQKGREFEENLYEVFAQFGSALGDETEFTGNTSVRGSRSKKGDFVATLGEASAAPGAQIVVEVKDSPLRLRNAVEELQQAKEARGAQVGILVFSRGNEPVEVGDFRRIGEDFYVTVDKDDLEAGRPLLYFESAYKIARAVVAAQARREAVGDLDLNEVQAELEHLLDWVDKIQDMTTKSNTIENSVKAIKKHTAEMLEVLDQRVKPLVTKLRHVNSQHN